MTRVLVTGGTGFLGSRVVRAFLADGAHVRCAGHAGSSTGPPRPAGGTSESLEYVEVDVRDRGDLVVAAEGTDLVVHTVAMTDPRTPEDVRVMEEVNVEGTRHVLEACRRGGVERLLHVSSVAALGISPDPDRPADEDSEYELPDRGLPYHRTKRRAERIVLGANGEGLETVVVNPGFMFGPHRGNYRGSEVIERVLGSPVVPCTRGGLSVVHVDDVTRGALSAARRGRPGERYVLSGENLTFREIAEVVCRVAGEPRWLLTVPDPVRDLLGFLKDSLLDSGEATFHPHLHGGYAHPFYSSEKARRELDHDPRGFDDVVADYLRHREQSSEGGAGTGNGTHEEER